MTGTKADYAQESYLQNRKRSADNQDGGRDAKRSNTGTWPLLKLMVPNYVAGALIGKGGAVLKEMKETYGAFVRLSGGREYYPGTEERIVVITGQASQIIDVNNLIMEKLQDPGRDSSMKNISVDVERAKQVKIILTSNASGLLIGRGGATIKAMQEESKARISIAMPDKATVQGERVVTISGSFDERTEACRQVIEKIAGDATNMSNTNTKYTSMGTDMYTGHTVNTGMPSYQGGNNINSGMPSYQGGNNVNSAMMRGNTGMSSYQGNNNMGSQSFQASPKKLKAKVHVEVKVPNTLVGAILGKQGSIIKDFVQRSGGARFKFEDKTEEEDRTLTITGDMDQTQSAYSLVNERVDQLQSQPSAQGF